MGDVALGTGFYIVQAVSILAIALVVSRALDVEYGGIPLLVAMLMLQLALPATAWYFAVNRKKARWASLGFTRKPVFKDLFWALAVLIAELGAQIVYYVILQAAGVDTENLSRGPLVDAGLEYLIGTAVLALIFAPLLEELFFRGFMFAGLAGRWGPYWAALASALLFMGAHLEPIRFPPLFVLGLLLAWLYHRTRSLWSPILVHLMNNAIAVGVMISDRY